MRSIRTSFLVALVVLAVSQVLYVFHPIAWPFTLSTLARSDAVIHGLILLIFAGWPLAMIIGFVLGTRNTVPLTFAWAVFADILFLILAMILRHNDILMFLCSVGPPTVIAVSSIGEIARKPMHMKTN